MVKNMGQPIAETAKTDLPHGLRMDDREKLHITGVTDVDRFDEETIILQTTRGGLTVSGTALHIEQLQLETGDIKLSGHIDTLQYSAPKEHRSLLGRMFR